jgi:hypothetical protein
VTWLIDFNGTASAPGKDLDWDPLCLRFYFLPVSTPYAKASRLSDP